ncbi:hypothetical protein CVS40_10064 [Lucilia cuprina]|nr:hypothetical protein CVS40_10064 [Lucilia cuprina]
MNATMTVNVTATSTSILIGFLEILTHENEFSYKLMELAKWIKEDRYYQTIIYMRHDDRQGEDYEEAYNTDKILKYLMCESDTTIMNLKGNTSYYLWYKYNRRIMALVHLNGNEYEDQELLITLWRTLKRNLLTRLILLVKKLSDWKYIEKILKFCYENKVINVMVINISLQKSNVLYTMEVFPEFKLKYEKIKKRNTTILFIDQVKNMQGAVITLVMNKASKRCYVLRVENGTFILGGFVGHFFNEFARKHNATLTFPNYHNLNKEMFLSALDALVENGTYDASTELTMNLYNTDLVYTKIYDYMDWCLMVPLEKSVPAYRFYIMVFDTASMIMIVVSFLAFSLILAVTYIVRQERVIFHKLLFNIYVLNGLLGQAFKGERSFSSIRSLLFMLICLSGLVFNTTYVTYLQTFNARPPKKHVINSLDDIKKLDMRIALFEEEFDLLRAFDPANEFTSHLKIIPTYKEYVALRSSFDSRYVYPVPSSQWTIFEQQQKFFSKPRYRMTNICILKMFGMQLPLQPNSPYEEAMNTLIGQVNQAGLVAYWKSLAFLEFVQLKRISLEDKSSISTFEPMKLEDMKLLINFVVYLFYHRSLLATSWQIVKEVYSFNKKNVHDEKQGKDYEEAYNTDKILKYLMCESNTPIMNLKGNTSYYLWYKYNRRFMAIVHLNGNANEDQELLITLWRTLKRNLLSRFILLLRKSKDGKYIESILNFCYENKVINVMAINISLQKGYTLYTMEAFPEFKMRLEKLKEKNTTVLFIDQIQNMQGAAITLIMHNVSTSCYILREENDTYILGGFVGHFLSEFARKHNATLTFPDNEELDQELFISLMDKLVENGTYDASTELSINFYDTFLVYTKTYDYLDWCLMVPVEKSVPAYKFYIMVFDTASMVMIVVAFVIFSIVLVFTYFVNREEIIFQELLFNINVLNGLLGQSFKGERHFSGVRSLLFMLICLSGLVFNTTYVTYLQTFNARPPKKHVINSLDDIKKLDMRIALFEEEFDLLRAFDPANEFTSHLKIIPTYKEYVALRSSFDSRYVYPVPSSQWTIFEQQQKFFSKPRYRLTDICILKMFGMQLPLQPNSPYGEAMNTLIGQVNQAGLVAYWKSLAFLEFIQLKRISLEDKSSISTFEPMKLEDMKLLMFLFIVIKSIGHIAEDV